MESNLLRSLPTCLLPFVRLSQRLIETRFAHPASLAAVALRKSVSTGRAPELDSGRRLTLTVGMDRGSFRSAPNALLAENLLALDADASHAHPRSMPKNWVGFAIATETAHGNGSVEARGQATVTIRAAIAAS